MKKELKMLGGKYTATKTTCCGSYTLIDLKDKDAEKLRYLEENNKIKNIFITVEYEDSILDDIEKRYLKNIIRPFIDEVDYITKWENDEGDYSIIITLYNFETITLPSFPIYSKMYVGMKPDQEYSLEELDLI